MNHPPRLLGASLTAPVCLAALGLGAGPAEAGQAARPSTAAAAAAVGRVLATIRVGIDVGPVAVDPGLGLA